MFLFGFRRNLLHTMMQANICSLYWVYLLHWCHSMHILSYQPSLLLLDPRWQLSCRNVKLAQLVHESTPFFFAHKAKACCVNSMCLRRIFIIYVICHHLVCHWLNLLGLHLLVFTPSRAQAPGWLYNLWQSYIPGHYNREGCCISKHHFPSL